MIYLASPYSAYLPSGDFDRELMQQRCDAVELALVRLVHKKRYAVSPIVLFHTTALRYDLPPAAAFWRNYNRELLLRCHELYILDLPGWQESRGIAYELGIAHASGKSVSLLDHDTYAAIRMEM